VLLEHMHGWQKTSLGNTNQDKALGNSSMMLRTGLREVEEETGVGLQPGIMRPWANLITPVGYHKRFDTFFFLATPGDDVMPENMTTEAVAADSLRNETIVDEAESERITIMQPTVYHR